MALYIPQHFPLGAAFVCQAGNFWTLLYISTMKVWICSRLCANENYTQKRAVNFYEHKLSTLIAMLRFCWQYFSCNLTTVSCQLWRLTTDLCRQHNIAFFCQRCFDSRFEVWMANRRTLHTRKEVPGQPEKQRYVFTHQLRQIRFP